MASKKYTFDDKTIDICYQVERFLHEIIEEKEYDYLFNDLVVLDIGCNIGTFSWSIYNKAKMIYAFDISQECIDAVNETIRMNGLDRIQAFYLGVAGNVGVRNISKSGDPHEGGWRIGGGEDNEATVPTTDLETFMNENQIEYVDVMKIDIEGGEREVFESQAFKNVRSRIHTILGEYHGEQIKADLGWLLEGYHVVIDENHSKFIAKKI